MHYSNIYYALTAPRYSLVKERRTDGETEKLDPKTIKNSPLRRDTPWCSTSSVYPIKISKETWKYSHFTETHTKKHLLFQLLIDLLTYWVIDFFKSFFLINIFFDSFIYASIVLLFYWFNYLLIYWFSFYQFIRSFFVYISTDILIYWCIYILIYWFIDLCNDLLFFDLLYYWFIVIYIYIYIYI